MSILNEANDCHKILVRLVSYANTICSELFRVKDLIPEDFINPSNCCKDLIFDYSYIPKSESIDMKINSSRELRIIDMKIKEKYERIIWRTFQVFESIYQYTKQVEEFYDKIIEGEYLQYNAETLLVDVEGKQLVCETLSFVVRLLLLLDILIPGIVRERILIFVLRHKRSNEFGDLDKIIPLVKRTEYIVGSSKKPSNYPDEYLKRIHVNDYIVQMAIGRMLSDDIYNTTKSFPLPDHRSSALSAQGSLLTMILFLSPQTLNNNISFMNEVVNKFFGDCWIVPIYIGHCIDLTFFWDSYKSARQALQRVVTPSHIENIWKGHQQVMAKCKVELQGYLEEGGMTDEKVMLNMQKLINCQRNCNVVLRWALLHGTYPIKKLRDIFVKPKYHEDIIDFLLETAQFEFELKRIIGNIVKEKPLQWENLKNESSKRMKDLSNYFNDENKLSEHSNSGLMKWCLFMSEQIDKLDVKEISSGKSLSKLIQAMEEVETNYLNDLSLVVVETVRKTKDMLTKMFRLLNVNDTVRGLLDNISDCSYANELLSTQVYVEYLQQIIKKNPRNSLKLRSLILKMSSILHLALLRMMQAKTDEQMENVSKYYSEVLVNYVQRVLEVIPEQVFLLINSIAKLQVTSIPETPVFVEKKDIISFALFDERNYLAELTHAVSIYAEGILAMETTFVGIIQVDPVKLLEDGIRKALGRRLKNMFSKTLQFKIKGNLGETLTQLSELSNQIGGFSTSFRYIQDYLHIDGLKVWQEEFTNVISTCVNEECNSFLANGLDTVNSQTFIGKLTSQIMSIVDYRKNVFYLSVANGWFYKDGKEVIGYVFMRKLVSALSVLGVTGINQLCAFKCVKELNDIITTVNLIVEKYSVFNQMTQNFNENKLNEQNIFKVIDNGLSVVTKIGRSLIDTLHNLGTLQLLREQLNCQLCSENRTKATSLHFALKSFDQALVHDFFENPNKKEREPLIYNEINRFLDVAGFVPALSKVYITCAEGGDQIASVLSSFILYCSQFFIFDSKYQTLMLRPKAPVPYDPYVLAVGIVTVFRQFHPSTMWASFSYLSLYVKGVMTNCLTLSKQIPFIIFQLCDFMTSIIQIGGYDKKIYDSLIPVSLLASLNQPN
ncbi:strumpellin, putative [Entamoeba histolytica HM-3:IMSS]|uniref:Strumpellin, putative n=2 Tax=Entamoeba histolytica TaxID=5759 RepID=M2S3U5_ENTHI|nr:strumpellin, putative [Entamoeba histolytica KU27]EMS12527.1 strumpellin, putative [Entamoeba histolytica HM-3:IMSS]